MKINRNDLFFITHSMLKFAAPKKVLLETIGPPK